MARSLLTASRLSYLIQKIYPKQLAGSWDNTGLLLESPFTRTATTPATTTKILICIDLTSSVCDEALNMTNCAHIVAYHPIIFSGIKSLTLANSQQRTLLRLAAAGISVYCPHTSVDAVKNGVNDMLVDAFQQLSSIKSSRAVELCKTEVSGFEGAGLGRIVKLENPINLSSAVGAIKKHLGLTHVQLARATLARTTDDEIRSIGLCAGSGGSVLKSCNVDLVLTGELSHHEQLSFVERGVNIIMCGHSDSERPFLPTMKRQLQGLLDVEGEDVEVCISKADASPFETS